jgi:hypothetical protein
VAWLVTSLLVVFWLVPMFGSIDLLTTALGNEMFREHYLLELGWGLLYTVLVAVPLLALVPRRATGLVWQLLAVAAGVAVGALVAGYPAQLIVVLLLVATAALAARVTSVRLSRPDRVRVDVPLLVPGVLLVVPAVLYAFRVTSDLATPTTDITMGLDHRPMQAGMAFAALFVALLAAVAAGSGVPGWRLSVWTAAVTVGWMGFESVLFPRLEASFGTVQGILAMGWAAVFVVVAELRARRTSPPQPEAPLGRR